VSLDEVLSKEPRIPVYPDDGTSVLTPSAYFRVRVQPWLAEEKRHLAKLRFSQSLSTKLIQFINLCCVGAAAASMQWAVPMLLALATAVNRTSQVGEIDNRIDVSARTIAAMEQQVVEPIESSSWWQLATERVDEEGTAIEAAPSEQFQSLVEMAERIISKSRTR